MGSEEEVVARVVVHEVADAAEARLVLPAVELALGHRGVVELHPADDAGDPRMPLRAASSMSSVSRSESSAWTSTADAIPAASSSACACSGVKVACSGPRSGVSHA